MRYSVLFSAGALAWLVRGHEDHHDQIPLDYVRFPQPIFRGSNEGKVHISYPTHNLKRLDIPGSDGRFNILGHHDFREAPVGSVPYQRTACPLRYRFHRRTIRN